MLVEKSFDTGEVVLNYAEGPNNGPPFVILLGYYHTWQLYKSMISTLKAQYHLYAVDARGTGARKMMELFILKSSDLV
jgi:hypothetical protein